MRADRELRVPRERTYAELFPWRNLGRVALLIATIAAIVVMKRSTGGFVARLLDIAAPAHQAPAAAPVPAPPSARRSP